jgi:hypothetical protein
VSRECGSRALEDSGIQPPVPQRIEGPGRRRPRLPRALRRLRRVEIEALWEERSPGPLPVRVLMGEQLGSEPLCRNAVSRGLPDLPR